MFSRYGCKAKSALKQTKRAELRCSSGKKKVNGNRTRNGTSLTLIEEIINEMVARRPTTSVCYWHINAVYICAASQTLNITFCRPNWQSSFIFTHFIFSIPSCPVASRHILHDTWHRCYLCDKSNSIKLIYRQINCVSWIYACHALFAVNAYLSSISGFFPLPFHSNIFFVDRKIFPIFVVYSSVIGQEIFFDTGFTFVTRTNMGVFKQFKNK